MNWKYIDASNRVAYQILNGSFLSSLVSALPDGTIIDAADPPPAKTQTELDTDAARIYDKLIALKGLTFAQVLTHVDTVFSNLSVAQRDDIKVLAVLAALHARAL